MHENEELSKQIEEMSLEEKKLLPEVVRHESISGMTFNTAQSKIDGETYIYAPDIDIHTIDMYTPVILEEQRIPVNHHTGPIQEFSSYKLSDVKNLKGNYHDAAGYAAGYATADRWQIWILDNMIKNIDDYYTIVEPNVSTETSRQLVNSTELNSMKDIVSMVADLTANKSDLTKEQIVSRISSSIRRKFKVTTRKQLLKKDFHRIINYILTVDLNRMKFRRHSN
jgi:hypothetical protein